VHFLFIYLFIFFFWGGGGGKMFLIFYKIKKMSFQMFRIAYELFELARGILFQGIELFEIKIMDVLVVALIFFSSVMMTMF
jgi:hypothetical protein